MILIGNLPISDNNHLRSNLLSLSNVCHFLYRTTWMSLRPQTLQWYHPLTHSPSCRQSLDPSSRTGRVSIRTFVASIGTSPPSQMGISTLIRTKYPYPKEKVYGTPERNAEGISDQIYGIDLIVNSSQLPMTDYLGKYCIWMYCTSCVNSVCTEAPHMPQCRDKVNLCRREKIRSGR